MTRGAAITPIPVRPPFDLRLTVGALRRLPTANLYPLVGDELRLVVDLSTGPRLLSVRVAPGGERDSEAMLECYALDG